MREIKFRAWCEKTGEMIAPIALDNEGRGITPGYQWWSSNNKLLHAPVMQYTGLKDKNGVEIFEGDIINAENGIGDDICVVGWHENNASFCLNKKGWMFPHYFGEAFDANKCEVIGNIYKHGSLLDGKQ